MRQQMFYSDGGRSQTYAIPDWATHWRKWYSVDRQSDAVQFTDSPCEVETPADAGQPDAVLISRWHELAAVRNA